MEDLFRDFWWLLFPIGWMVYAAIGSVMAEGRRREALKLVASYQANGREPPAELMRLAYGKEN
jgi:hypothetical protein